MPATDGPHLAIAVICERALIEKDDVMSLIRIFDRWMVQGPFIKMPPSLVPLSLVVSLRAGSYRGKAEVSIVPKSPSGRNLDLSTPPALIEFPGDKGDEQGANLIASLSFLAEEEGIYWFDILLDGKLISRVPLKLVYGRVEGAAPVPQH